MLLPKLRIPRMAVASLVLGGAASGCGAEGGGIESLARDFCSVLARCSPAAFAEDYASVAECRVRFERDFRESVDGGVTPECRRATVALYRCLIDASTPQCVDPDHGGFPDACTGAYTSYYYACAYDDYYYYY